MLLFLCVFHFFFRVHILLRGRIPLWAKWTGSAEKAAAWISGCPSSTCPNDDDYKKKPARGLEILHKSGVNPDGHITIQRSNSKVFRNVDEARDFWEKRNKKIPQLLSTRGCISMRKPRKKKEAFLQGMDFHFGQKSFGVATGSRGKTRRHGSRMKPKACVCFLMWRRTLSRRTVSCMRCWTSARRRESAEEPENDAAGQSEAAGTKHLFKHWTF